MTRRELLLLLGVSALPGCATLPDRAATGLAALERRAGGRLGVAILDTGSGRWTGHRAGERFGMCSTFKMPLAAIVFAEIDAGRIDGAEIVPIAQADLVPHHPVTGQHVGKGLSVLALAEAAQVTSDNAAANLLLKRLGGPAGFTRQVRGWGDPVTRLDRFEPEMNLVPPGELRDTTTPLAMARLTARILTGDALAPASRERLIGWMVATRSGQRRLRAGLPPDWRAGDKTGSSWNETVMVDKINDVAIVWPPGRAPLIVAAYYDGPLKSRAIRPEDEAVLAEAGRIAAAWV